MPQTSPPHHLVLSKKCRLSKTDVSTLGARHTPTRKNNASPLPPPGGEITKPPLIPEASGVSTVGPPDSSVTGARVASLSRGASAKGAEDGAIVGNSVISCDKTLGAEVATAKGALVELEEAPGAALIASKLLLEPVGLISGVGGGVWLTEFFSAGAGLEIALSCGVSADVVGVGRSTDTGVGVSAGKSGTGVLGITGEFIDDTGVGVSAMKTGEAVLGIVGMFIVALLESASLPLKVAAVGAGVTPSTINQLVAWSSS